MKRKQCLFLVAITIVAGLIGCAGSVREPVVKQEPQLYSVDFDIILKEVERPADAIEHYGERSITQLLDDGVQKNRFDDDMIGFICYVATSKIMFVLENKTKHSIHILWDEAAFVDENGRSHKVMHSGVKYDDRYVSQPPSIVVRKGEIVDSVISSDNITGPSEKLSERVANQALQHKYNMTEIRRGRLAVLDQKIKDTGTAIILLENSNGSSKTKPLFPVAGILDTAAIVEMQEIAGNSERPLSEVAYEYLGRWTYDQAKTSAEKHIGKTIQVLLPLRIAGQVNEYIFVFEVEDVGSYGILGEKPLDI